MATKQRHLTFFITYVAMCIALLTVCAWISIPFSVSFTMQTFAVFLIAALSDWKQSLTAVVLYVMLGVLGAPVFAGFQAGPAVFSGATGGYLIGFACSMLIIGLSVQRWGQTRAVLLVSMLLSLAVCYLCGTLWYWRLYLSVSDRVSFFAALGICVLPFLIPDILKMMLAIALTHRLSPCLQRLDRTSR